MHHSSNAHRRLRIGIDAHALGSGLGGNETYLRCLLQGLRLHPEHDYVLYTSYPGSTEIAEQLLPGSLCHHVSANPLRRLGIDLSLASFRDALDLIHLQYVSPLVTACPVSLLIHDLSYEHNPDWFRSSEVSRFRWTIPRSAVASDIVLTVSQYCKEDIAQRLHLPADKITVTPNALPPIYKKASEGEVSTLKEKLRLPARYILALGNLQPRKNITTLLQAWKMIRNHPDMKDVSLVVTGKKAWLYDEILSEAGVDGAEEAPEERIQFTGYLPEADLPALYSGALIFVYPSLFEGFGLPPIEAMACGTPVLVGRNSALPEICGEAVKYADVTSAEELGRAIRELALNEEEQKALSSAGIVRARSFSLENLINPTLHAWESIAHTN